MNTANSTVYYDSNGNAGGGLIAMAQLEKRGRGHEF
jgi:hypothetical protein